MPAMTSGRSQYAGLGLSRLMHRIANKVVLPSPKAEPKRERKKYAGGNIKLTDEAVLALIRRVRSGECLSRIAASEGLGRGTLEQWVSGENRGHLLAQIEREEREASRRGR